MKFRYSKRRAPGLHIPDEDIVYSIWKHMGKVGFKSMVQTFINRTPFQYGIKSLDDLLRIDGMTGASANSAFLLYDEQILKILITGGIDPAKAYTVIKAVKKKKVDKVMAAKDEFRQGFSRYLMETEGANEQKANEIVDKIWKIIEDSSSYLF